jgi:hypothetical protein
MKGEAEEERWKDEVYKPHLSSAFPIFSSGFYTVERKKHDIPYQLKFAKEKQKESKNY